MVKYASPSNAAKWVVSQYRGLIEKPPSTAREFVVIGAPSGAAAHLSSLLNAPFLTQHFLLLVKRRVEDVDDVWARLESGATVARELLKLSKREVEVVVHYDPVHDRLILKYLDTVRFKLKSLPEAYRSFISRVLGRSGAIVFLDVDYEWKQYVIEEGLFMQVGGLGGISPDEYLYGSTRLSEWLESRGSRATSWNLDCEYPVVERSESEWGTAPGLEEEVEEFASDAGYEFIKIHVNSPVELSERVFEVFVKAFGRAGVGASRFFLDCFTAINPFFNMQTSSIPVWLPFNCEYSYGFAKSIANKLAEFSGERALALLTLLPNYDETPDQVHPREWVAALENVADVLLVGTSTERYPLDLLYPFNYMKDIAELHRELRKPAPRPDSEFLENLLKSL